MLQPISPPTHSFHHSRVSLRIPVHSKHPPFLLLVLFLVVVVVVAMVVVVVMVLVWVVVLVVVVVGVSHIMYKQRTALFTQQHVSHRIV